jgi:hypothetical protein
MEKNDLTNFTRPKSLANRYRFDPHFLKWDFYCMNILPGRNGSNIGTNCSIAVEIVFYVPHNDLSSFSILRAVEREINFGSFFP